MGQDRCRRSALSSRREHCGVPLPSGRWDGKILLLSNHEVDSGNDFYPKIEDAAEEKPAGAEVRMDAVPDCKVDSMKTEDRRLAATTGGLQ